MKQKLGLALAAWLCVSISGWAADQADEADQIVDAASDGQAEDEPKWDVENPPGEWREITIDTDETTWSSIDVSPDGGTIVFDMLGDLYTVGIAGGVATSLTSGIAWDMQPKFSPDGTRIAFISDRGGADNLWVMDADGSNARAVTEEKEHLIHNPAWSPDGDWIVVRKGYVSTRSIPSGEIWMYHASGGEGLQVVERPHGEQSQKNIAEPVFSPDGRYVYYSQDNTPGTVWQYNKDPTGQIFVIQRLDREERETEVYVGGPGGAIAPMPSPDGSQLAFIKRLPDTHSAIYLKDAASGNERPLYLALDRDLQETNGSQGNYPAMSWTPDGESIVFWAGGKLRRVEVDSGESKVIPVRINDTRQVRKTVRFPVEVWQDEFPVRAIRWARYSPDGSKVVFQALGYLYVKDVKSGKQARLTSQNDHFEFWPSWSPDGKRIAYTTWDDQDLGSVRVVSARGGRGEAITDAPGHYMSPRFSPDGEQIVYRKFEGGYLLSPKWSVDPGLYVVDADGGKPTRVSKSGDNPQFDSAGERVLFTETDETGVATLKSVNLQGDDPLDHMTGKKITEFSVSPDGRWVAFTEQFNAYLAPFPLTGKAVELSKDAKSVPVRQISARSGEYVHWAGDSLTVHWALGARLYSRALNEAFSFIEGAPEELPEPVESGIDLSFTVPADRPQGTIAITNARVITMRNADRFEEVIQDGAIVVEGNRIVAVGQMTEVEIPDDAWVLDAAGKTVIPGLVDAHAHGGMAMNEITPQQNWQQFSNLAFGVTTIHDPSNDSTEIFSHAELQQAGQVIGPRTFSTGTILYGALYPGYTAEIDSYEDALFHVRRLKDLGAISVKSYNQLRRDSRQQVIAAGAAEGIMIFPEGGAKFQHNLNEIVDGHTGIEHAIPIATGYEDVVQLWSATETGYTPTFGVAYGGLSGETYWYDRTRVWENERLLRYAPRSVILPPSIRRTTAPDEHYNHIQVARFAKTLRDEGVSIQIGAHGQREGLAAHWELWMMEQGGFTPWEAIRAGTIDGAHYLGMDQSIGSIEPGKLADLVIIDGNPLEDLRRSEYVSHTIINGRVFDVSSMNEIGHRQREREPFYFETEGGDVFPVEAR